MPAMSEKDAQCDSAVNGNWQFASLEQYQSKVELIPLTAMFSRKRVQAWLPLA